MRIAFVINSLGYGGAERVLEQLLAFGLQQSRASEVHLVLLDDQPERRAVPPGVIKHTLHAQGRLGASALQLHRILARIRPDLSVSFLVRANVCNALVGRTLNCPTVLCERMHLSSHLAGRYQGMRKLAAAAAPWLTYRLATRILGVSSGVTEDLVAHFAVPAGKAQTLFNPYDLAAIRRAGEAEPEIRPPARFAVAVARLDPAKNLLQLIDAVMASDAERPLLILGEGRHRPQIEDHVRRNGLSGRVILAGHLQNPFAVMARAEVYVSASLNEGFPNAMVEAMALGVPVVASDCRSGPAEILQGELTGSKRFLAARYGVLVRQGSVEALSEGLGLLSDAPLRAHYRQEGARRAEAFSLESVADQYWRLFEACATGGV